MQGKSDSFWESVEGAVIAAPTAMLLHKGLLMVAEQNALNENQNLFIAVSWIFFLTHSILWRYFVRRINTKYHIHLSPLAIIRRWRSHDST